MPRDGDYSVTVEFNQAEYDRLTAVTDDPADMIRGAAMERVELAESISYTKNGGFHGPDGFAKIADEEYPTWPLGSVLGIELESMGDGEATWTMDAGPHHANPMGTMHGGVLCDIGDAALSTAYMSTLEADESFTTVDLSVHFLRPVRSGRLDAVGRVVHRGRRIGMAESEVINEDGELVAKLSGTCMTLGES